MQIKIQARLVNSETKEVFCFKHAVQSVVTEQTDFDFELDDFSSYISEAPCVKCNPGHYDFGDYDCGDDEEREVGNEVHIDFFKKFPKTVEEKTEEEIRAKGFVIKSKIKKGK